jgi:hypothetical protein
MGIYLTNCPSCNRIHNWFSDDADQRCSSCKLKYPNKEMKLDDNSSSVLTNDTNITVFTNVPFNASDSSVTVNIIESNKSLYIMCYEAFAYAEMRQAGTGSTLWMGAFSEKLQELLDSSKVK